MKTTLLLVGCGKMGNALLEGWLEKGIAPDAITVIEPNTELGKAISQNHNFSVIDSCDQLPGDYQPDIIVFAVKPQIMAEAIPAYRPYAEAGSVCLSIAAGKTIAFFEQYLGKSSPIVRAMPNTPASIQRGISALFANQNVSESQHKLCEELLETVSSVVWIDDENLMDAITAVSGSGPAYIFLMAECLAEAGIAAGLPADLAKKLARTTVSGSGEMLNQLKEESSTLRENVTSPGGTTAAALDVLMSNDEFKNLLSKAVQAATARSKELAD